MWTMTLKSQDMSMENQVLTLAKNTVCSVDSNQNVNSEFKISDIKYFLNE